MNGLKLKSCGEFDIGKYRSRKDVLRRKDVKEEQIMAALGKSKTFNVRDWFGGTDTHTFAIVDIAKTKYGDYMKIPEDVTQKNGRFHDTVTFEPDIPYTVYFQGEERKKCR